MEVWEAANESAETDTPAASAVDSAQKLETLPPDLERQVL